MTHDFPDQSDPTRFLPFYLETAGQAGACHELEVVGWADDVLRRTVLRAVIAKLAGTTVECRERQTESAVLRSIAAGLGHEWSGTCGQVYRRIRDDVASRKQAILFEDAHHLAPRFFHLLQGLVHDTPSFVVLASGSALLFQRLWRAARGREFLVYCRIHPYGVPLPKPLLTALRERALRLTDLLRPRPHFRIHRPE